MGSLSSFTPPFFEEGISAGFPSPTEDTIETPLDLNALVIRHPTATFFIRVQGNSMEGAGIYSGDILVVDRALSPSHNQIIVALYNGEFTVKRLKIESTCIRLVAEHPDYPPLEIAKEADFHVWGVVTYVIHRTH